MSALSSLSLGSSLSAGALPPVDAALEPESIRTGDRAARNAYQEGLAFEDVLVGQLAQTLTDTVPGLDGSAGSPSAGADPTDLASSGSGLGAYASLLPQALSTGVMGDGGTGIAMEIARAIDPGIGAASPEPKR